jgi:glutamine amidotransferase
MCRHSEEGDTSCLGIFDQQVKKFGHHLKVPQIGWNTINGLKSPLFCDINCGDYMYFVHSYYVELGGHTIAATNYDISYSSALHKDNFYATQFHPEKSSRAGQQVLENFIKLS